MPGRSSRNSRSRRRLRRWFIRFQHEAPEQAADANLPVSERGSGQRQLGRGLALRKLLQKTQLENALPVRRQMIPAKALDQQARLGGFLPVAGLRAGGIIDRRASLSCAFSPGVHGLMARECRQPGWKAAALKRSSKLGAANQPREQLVNRSLAIRGTEQRADSSFDGHEVLAVAPLECPSIAPVKRLQP